MRALILLPLLGLLLLSGCSRQEPLFIGDDAPAVAPYLEVVPTTAEVNVGTSQAFTAYRVDPIAQTREDVTASVTWTSASSSIASINTGGTATGLAAGSSVIQARSAELTAFANLAVSNETLTSVQIFPVESVALVGMERNFEAIALFANGRTQNITDDATWSSNNTVVADVVSEGLVTALSQGTATLEATFGGITSNASLAVLNATVDAFSVSPPVATIETKTSETFSANLLLSSGDTIDISEQVTWSTTDGTVATVNNQNGSKGIATGLSSGTANIVASVSFANITLADSASLTVVSPTLQSLEVTPANVNVPAGTVGSLVATAYYSDNSARDVTRDTYWNSSDNGIVFIESTGTQAGFGQALAPGSATVTARFGGLSEQAAITVSNANLTAIQVTPPLANIAIGTTTGFFATGIFSDGSSRDITAEVSWESANTAIARIDESGLAYGINVGSTSISASYQNQQGDAEITVTNATITGIEVSPALHRIQVGSIQPYTAVALFSNGQRYDITRLAYWASDTPSVVEIDRSGRAIAIGAGNATINAAFKGQNDSALAVVTDTSLKSLLVIPKKLDLQVETQQAYSAVAFYTDHIEDVTATASWRSSDTQLATVSNQIGTKGVVQTLSPGQVEISASFEDQSDSGELIISAPTITAIDVNCAETIIQAGNKTFCEAIASYSDGHKQDITVEAQWQSSASNIAAVENAEIDRVAGRVTGIRAGSADIIAALSGLTGSQTVTVNNAALQSIAVTSNETTLTVGDTEQFFATGTYSDGSTDDLTRSAVWASNNSGVLSVSNSLGRTGEAVAVSAGSTSLTATQDGITGISATITVQAELPSDNVQKLNVLCLNGSVSGPVEIEVGETDLCKAYATLKNGTVEDVTTLTTWAVDAPTTLTIVGFDANDFLEVRGAASGNTLLRAEYFKKSNILFKVR